MVSYVIYLHMSFTCFSESLGWFHRQDIGNYTPRVAAILDSKMADT